MRIATILLCAFFWASFWATLLTACGDSGGASSDGEWGKKKESGDEFKVPVQVQKPGRGKVEDWVETQANLESDRRAMILAEINGRVMQQHRELGDRIGAAENGSDPFLLATIDDRDLRLALREAVIKVKEIKGRLAELKVDSSRSERSLEQSKLEAEEAAAILRRTSNGIADGTITAEEHESAQFAEKVAHAKVRASEASLEKTRLEVELGAVLVEDAQVKQERAEVALEKTQLRAPFEGVVSHCEIHVGERVRVGDHLYTVEDPTRIVVYGEIPVREANRIKPGNEVHIGSSALPHMTTGRVDLIAPTVDAEAGTIRVKISIDPKPGFRPGLFVTMRIVVETRENALVVPKRAVLHDDETGPYLFVIKEDKARRVRIRTGFESSAVIEVVEGVDPEDDVVVEGQDTVSDEADVEIQADAQPTEATDEK